MCNWELALRITNKCDWYFDHCTADISYYSTPWYNLLRMKWLTSTSKMLHLWPKQHSQRKKPHNLYPPKQPNHEHHRNASPSRQNVSFSFLFCSYSDWSLPWHTISEVYICLEALPFGVALMKVTWHSSLVPCHVLQDDVSSWLSTSLPPLVLSQSVVPMWCCDLGRRILLTVHSMKNLVTL